MPAGLSMLSALLSALLPMRALDDVPKVGAAAPDFSVADQDGHVVTRDSLRGKKVVLAFYPKDFTGG